MSEPRYSSSLIMIQFPLQKVSIIRIGLSVSINRIKFAAG